MFAPYVRHSLVWCVIYFSNEIAYITLSIFIFVGVNGLSQTHDTFETTQSKRRAKFSFRRIKFCIINWRAQHFGAAEIYSGTGAFQLYHTYPVFGARVGYSVIWTNAGKNLCMSPTGISGL